MSTHSIDICKAERSQLRLPPTEFLDILKTRSFAVKKFEMKGRERIRPLQPEEGPQGTLGEGQTAK
jgi:hypothetical protein